MMKQVKCMILKCILKCVISNCKPPQYFEFPETELSCRFIWFEKFHSTGRMMRLIAYHLFYSVLLFYFSSLAAVKTLKKHHYAPTRRHKKS